MLKYNKLTEIVQRRHPVGHEVDVKLVMPKQHLQGKRAPFKWQMMDKPPIG